MFENIFVLIIIGAIFNALSKSIDEKKNIDKSKRDKSIERNREEYNDSINTVEFEPEPKYQPEPYEYTYSFEEYNKTEEKIPSNIAIDDLTTSNILEHDLTKDSKTAKHTIKKKKQKKSLKKEIVKGIVYSEILSEPKSIQNFKKVM